MRFRVIGSEGSSGIVNRTLHSVVTRIFIVDADRFHQPRSSCCACLMLFGTDNSQTCCRGSGGKVKSPAALYPVSLRACQLGDAVYVYCSLSALIASCLDILCSYIGVVRSVWTIQSRSRLRNVTGVSRRSDYYRYRKALWSLSMLAFGPRFQL